MFLFNIKNKYECECECEWNNKKFIIIYDCEDIYVYE